MTSIIIVPETTPVIRVTIHGIMPVTHYRSMCLMSTYVARVPFEKVCSMDAKSQTAHMRKHVLLLHRWRRVVIQSLHHPVNKVVLSFVHPRITFSAVATALSQTESYKAINRMCRSISAGKASDNNSSRAANCRGLDVRVRCFGQALREANAVQCRTNSSAQMPPSVTILQCTYWSCIIAAHSDHLRHEADPGHNHTTVSTSSH